MPESTISILNYDGGSLIQEPEGTVVIDMTMQSLSGVDKLDILVDGKVVETVDVENAFTYNYTYDYHDR
ncbi:MAG: hypothetical protein Q4G11_05630 [Gallicola sp.]|nr:hypothetical protein [Gallicola sp.]